VDLPVRPGRIIQQDLDIAEYTDPENNPMIPHTLVLKPGLTIHSIDNGYWLWGRPSFYDLREATKEIRPDWDLNTPGLRETWNAGDYSPFHGWDKRSTQPPPPSGTAPKSLPDRPRPPRGLSAACCGALVMLVSRNGPARRQDRDWSPGRAGKGPTAPLAGAAGALGCNQIA